MPDEPTTITEPVTPAAPPAGSTPPADVPWYQKSFTAGPEFQPGWQNHVPGTEEHREMLSRYGSMKELAESLKTNMTAARAKPATLTVPGDDATPEQVAAYRAAGGIPESPYTIEKPETLPEGVAWSDKSAAAFGELAHKIHLTPKQVAALQNFDMERLTGDIGERTLAQSTQEAALLAEEKVKLKEVFGPKLDSAIVSAQRVGQMHGMSPDEFDPASENFLGVRMLGIFSKFAEAVGESHLPTVASVSNMNPLNQARDIVRNNPKYSSDPALQAQVDKLYAMAAAQGLS